MNEDNKIIIDCKKLADDVRYRLIKSAKSYNGEGHWGGYLSCVEILSVLLGGVSNFCKDNEAENSKDYFFLSKGHSAKALYTVQLCLGKINEEVFDTFGRKGSPMSVLGEYCPEYGVMQSGGSLGLGLPLAVGAALLAKRKGYSYTTYVLVGDGELNEGANWEALMTASKYKLNNLCCIIDNNKFQSDGACSDILSWGDLSKKIESFGADVNCVDGHNCREIYQALCKKSEEPKVIVANTIKGKGVSFMENNNEWHHARLYGEKLKIALEEIK